MPWLDHGIHAVPHPHGTASKPRTVIQPNLMHNALRRKGRDAMIKSWHDGGWGGRRSTKEENPLKSESFVMPWLDHGIHAVPHPHGTASKPRTVIQPNLMHNALRRKGRDAMIKSWHDGGWGGRRSTKEENPLKSESFVMPWLDHGRTECGGAPMP